MEDKNTKLSFLKFLDTVRWLFVYNIKLAPVAAIFNAFASIFSTASPLVNAYIFARLLDDVIKIATAHGDPKEIIPMLGVLLAYNLFNSAINATNGYASQVMHDATQFKSPQVLYRHIHSLGIQTLENPEVANKIQRSKEIIGALYGDFERAIAFFARIFTLIAAALIVVKVMPIVMMVIVISILPEMVSNKFHMRKNWKLYRDETENRRGSNFIFSSLIETSNLQEITITSAYEYLNNVYKKFADRYTKEDLKILKGWQFFGFLFGSITDITSIFGYFTILKNLFSGITSIGTATFQMRSLEG